MTNEHQALQRHERAEHAESVGAATGQEQMRDEDQRRELHGSGDTDQHAAPARAAAAHDQYVDHDDSHQDQVDLPEEQRLPHRLQHQRADHGGGQPQRLDTEHADDHGQRKHRQRRNDAPDQLLRDGDQRKKESARRREGT